MQPPGIFTGTRTTLAWVSAFSLQIPAYMLGSRLIDSNAGRRLSATTGIGLGGVLLFILSVKRFYFTNIIYYPARMAIALAFAIVHQWSSELFPSSIRSSCMACSSFFARLGAAL